MLDAPRAFCQCGLMESLLLSFVFLTTEVSVSEGNPNQKQSIAFEGPVAEPHIFKPASGATVLVLGTCTVGNLGAL